MRFDSVLHSYMLVHCVNFKFKIIQSFVIKMPAKFWLTFAKITQNLRVVVN